MTFKHSRFITVAIGSSQVRVAQISKSGTVEKVAQKAFSDGGGAEALKSAVVGFDPKAAVICTLPGEIATAKNIEVPAVDEKEIEAIVALQAPRHTSFHRDEILIGYIILPSSRPNFTRVLLIIVKREAVKDRIALIRSAGLACEGVVFAPEAIARFYARALGLKRNDAPISLLDVEEKVTNLIVVSQGNIVMSRTLPVGAEQIATGEDAVAQLASEVNASLDAYEQEGIGVRPRRFCLTKDHGVVAGLSALLAEPLAGTVESRPYLKSIHGSKAIRDMIAVSFADAGALDIIASGVALSQCQADMAPQEIRDQRSIAEKGLETMKAGVLLLVTLFLVGGALLMKIYFKDMFLKRNLIEEYAPVREEVARLEGMAARTRIMRDYLESREIPLDVIRELYQIIPQEIYLSSVNIDPQGIISLQGISDSMSKVFSFVTALEESPLLEGVKTRSTAAKKDRGKDVATFDIVMKVAGAAVPAEEPAAEGTAEK